MADDIDGRKSTSGVLFFLGDCPITWQSQKQKIIALSTCEAEYIAMATASCQGVWLARRTTNPPSHWLRTLSYTIAANT
jgi:hypothetical protein